jgi:hypothetical protein
LSEFSKAVADSGKTLENMEFKRFGRGKGAEKRRRATDENSPQFQLRVVMPKTGQAPAGRQTDGERFDRPSGTGIYLAGETRS